jgi:hypothetical protein
VGADEFSTYILVIKVNTGTTPEFYQISFDEKG